MSLVKPSILRNARLLKALRNIFGRKTFGAKSIIEATLRQDTRGKELSAVIVACVGITPTMQGIGTYLSKVKGSEFLGLKLTAKYSKDKRTWRYDVAASGDAELIQKIREAKQESERVKAQLISKARYEQKLAQVPQLEPLQYTLSDVRYALQAYQRKHGADRAKAMFHELTGLEPDLDLLPVEKYAAVIERCLAAEPKHAPETTTATAQQSSPIAEVMKRTADYERPQAAAIPKPTAPIQHGMTHRVPSWIRKGLAEPPNTMPFRVHQAASSGLNLCDAFKTSNDWNPFSILRS